MSKVNNIGKTTAYLPKEKGGHFSFKPGMNEIDSDDLTYIIKKQDGKWNIHYSKYLIVQSEHTIEIKSNVNDTENTESVIDEKTVVEIRNIVAGMDEDELKILAESENGRDGGPRKTVMAMIEKALKKFKNE